MTPRKTQTPARLPEYELGEVLKNLRTERGLSQAELGQGAGLSQSTIAAIETGRKDPSVETLRRVARVLDTDLATIFAGNEIFSFDLRRMRRKYPHADKLTPYLYMALGKVIQYARDIKFLKP